MRLEIVAIGRLKAGPERELAQRYAERIEAGGRAVHLSGPLIIELPESAARRGEDRKAEEGQAIAARLGAGFRLVIFDEGGAVIDSAGFARMIGAWRDANVAGASFVIGGADGLDPALARRAEHVLAFGRMTIPHQIVRALVLEQLYRATTILAGHPYHRI